MQATLQPTTLQLHSVERRKSLSSTAFAAEYLQTLTPVIFTDLMTNWKATSKWTIPFFKEKHGQIPVPLYSKNVAQVGKKYLKPEVILPLAEYLELLEAGPTDLRMFLFNIFRYAPDLLDDFSTPTITNGFLNRFPFLFFGGQHSKVGLHYDIDLSHVFLNQFHGRKKVVLFPQSESKNIYQHPFTVASFVDTKQPDFQQFPALRQAKGYECTLNPGETLFIPSAFWHSVEYLDGGYSMSLRANESYLRRAKGFINIASHFVVDRSMNRILGQKWRNMKANWAEKRANSVVI